MPNTSSIDDFANKVMITMITRQDGVNKLNTPTHLKIQRYKLIGQ